MKKYFKMLRNIQALPGIYKITSPIGKVYIGRSINVKKRIREHNRKNNTLISRSIEKYGFSNHTFEVLVYAVNDTELLNQLEVFFIKKYESTDRSKGLNLTEGGGRLNFRHTPETIKKMKENRAGWRNSLGRKMSDETRSKISKSLSGQKISCLTKSKIQVSLLNIGRSKLFLDLYTGVYYYSERDLATYSEFSSRTVLRKTINNSKRYICC